MSPRLLRDPRLPADWSTFVGSLGYEVLETSATSPPALLAEAHAREAVLLTADPACELARCELRAPLPSLFLVRPELQEGLRFWLERYAADWSRGLMVEMRTATMCEASTLALLGHEGTTTVGEQVLAWRTELRPPEAGSRGASVKLVLRAFLWIGSALVLPATQDARPTPAELSLAARVGLVHGWAPGADLPDVSLPFDAWTGADNLHACPCCDYRTLRARGDYLACPVCGWEDDGTHPAHLDDYSPCNHRHLRRARSRFRRLGPTTRRSPRPPDALRSCYVFEPLEDPRRLRLMPAVELSPDWLQALAQIGALVPGPPCGDPQVTHKRARHSGAVVVTSDPAHLARRWPSPHPSLVLVEADPAGAATAAARIQAHARDLRRGALLLGEELIDLQGVLASGEIEVDGVVFWWKGGLRAEDRPTVVVTVVHDEAPPDRSALVFDGAGLFTTRRNGRTQIDAPALRCAIQAGLRAGWRHDHPGEDRVIPWPPP